MVDDPIVVNEFLTTGSVKDFCAHCGKDEESKDKKVVEEESTPVLSIFVVIGFAFVA